MVYQRPWRAPEHCQYMGTHNVVSVGGYEAVWGRGKGRKGRVVGPFLLVNGCQMGAGGPNVVYQEPVTGPMAPWWTTFGLWVGLECFGGGGGPVSVLW